MDRPRTPTFSLAGKRALVTGGSRGIGFATAIALADAGADVTVVARRVEPIGGMTTRSLDVSDFGTVREFIERQPPFDILVNSAGAARHASFLDITVDEYRSVIDLNLGATLFVSQAVAARLVASGKPGSIINVSSQMGHVGGPTRGVYAASKFAVEGLTKSMAIDLAPHNIRVNTLCPTFIETELGAKTLSDPGARAWVMSKIKLGRLGRLEDIMGPVVFLASDAAAMMTGSAMMVDGGWTAE